MDDFKCLYSHPDLQLQFYKPEDMVKLNLRPNAKVRIEDGIFTGIESYYQQVKGARGKCFVVKVENFMARAAFLTRQVLNRSAKI